MANREDVVVIRGVVSHNCKGAFKVSYETNDGVRELNATPSGKMRQNQIQVLTGDKVEVECSVHDTSRGRITRRLDKNSL